MPQVYKAPPSVKDYDEIVVTIQDVSRGGEGVGRLEDGRVVFVRYTAAGDRVRARIIHTKKHFVHADLVEILQASPERVKQRCPVFGVCGGCEWQHLDYTKQWAIKRRGLNEVMTRFGLVYDGVIDEFPASQVWNYRNRVQLRGEGDQLGFLAYRSHSLVPIKDCPLAHPAINHHLEALRARVVDGPYKVEVEVSADLGIHESWNEAHAHLGFRQVHESQNTLLQKWMGDQFVGGELVWDLFGGDGNLSLALSNRARAIHCVDVGAGIRRKTAPKNYFFHQASVEIWLEGYGKKSAVGADNLVVIIDPPRQGASAIIKKLTELQTRLPLKKIIMISCFPDTWARDVNQLLYNRWHLKRLGLIDFFPQTHHVEVLSVLSPS